MIDSGAKKMFELLADSLEAFRSNYGLHLEKYWHDMPSWRFSFQHPRGGTGCVELAYDSPGIVEVASYWWKDDYEEGRRRSRREFSRSISMHRAVTELESDFLQMLKWKSDSLTEITEGFKEIWHNRYSKEQFDSFASQFPQLRGHE